MTPDLAALTPRARGYRVWRRVTVLRIRITVVEICKSGHESLGDSIALRHEQRTGPRAKILRNDHVEQTRPPNSCSCR
jgi:hypothetical protein